MKRHERVERAAARAAHALLVRRGWIVQLNTDEFCHSIETRDGKVYDRGWRPLFSIRYGHTPVYRGPGERRWTPR